MEKTHGNSVTSSKYNYGCRERTKIVLSQMSNHNCPDVWQWRMSNALRVSTQTLTKWTGEYNSTRYLILIIIINLIIQHYGV